MRERGERDREREREKGRLSDTFITNIKLVYDHIVDIYVIVLCKYND